MKYYCLIKLIESVMKMNRYEDISMIRSLQSIYNMFKLVNFSLLGINMNVLSKKGVYVRICRKQDYYVTMEEYKTIQYHYDREYYKNSSGQYWNLFVYI